MTSVTSVRVETTSGVKTERKVIIFDTRAIKEDPELILNNVCELLGVKIKITYQVEASDV